MKKNLGKLILFLIFSLNLFATVTLKVDKTSLIKGDELQVTISADSQNAVLPTIDNIAGYEVLNISSSSSTSIINSDVKYIKSRTYTIAPTSDFTIPVFKVVVDGVTQYTKPKDIKILQTSTTNSNGSNFSLILKTSKKNIKVGESIEVKIVFKIRLGTNVDKIGLDELKHEDFWIKKVGCDQRDIVGDYQVYTRTYLLFAQKSGNFTIDSLIAKVGVLKQQRNNFSDPFFDSFFQKMTYKNIHSNSISIHVTPLPNNLEVYGDFSLESSVDRENVEADKPVNLTIKIKGEGNFEDIKKFKLQIKGTTIFTDEPNVKSYIEDGKPYGEFIQKIAIISDANYTIPKISFSYYSQKEDKEVTKYTKEFNIKVEGNSKEKVKIQKPLLQKQVKNQPSKSENIDKYIYFLVGLFLGIALSSIAYLIKIKKPKKDETPIVKKIKRAKSDKQLYDLLLPYIGNQRVKIVLNKLEKNIYHVKKIKIDKKEIIEIFEEDE